MSPETVPDWQSWREHASGRRQGLARRKLVLTWMLQDPRNQDLSAREISDRCPVYAEHDGSAEGPARADLNAMRDYDCTVLASRNRPARWSVTALGAE